MHVHKAGDQVLPGEIDYFHVVFGNTQAGAWTNCCNLVALDENGLVDNRTLVAVVQSFTAHSILANLREPGVRFYYPQLDRFGSFTSWSAQWGPSSA